MLFECKSIPYVQWHKAPPGLDWISYPGIYQAFAWYIPVGLLMIIKFYVHSEIGYLSPEEFEEHYQRLISLKEGA